MAKTYNLQELQPDELNELKDVVRTYVSRLNAIDAEIADLRESKRELKEEYVKKLDIKTLGIVMRILKAEESVEHKDTFDLYREATQDMRVQSGGE